MSPLDEAPLDEIPLDEPATSPLPSEPAATSPELRPAWNLADVTTVWKNMLFARRGMSEALSLYILYTPKEIL